jgi:hypothetical protein
MSRQPSPLVAQRHEVLLARIRALTAAPPCWGDRRLWASLPFVEPLSIHKKRSLRRRREHHLLGLPNPRLYTPTPDGFERFLRESVGLPRERPRPTRPPRAARHGASRRRSRSRP